MNTTLKNQIEKTLALSFLQLRDPDEIREFLKEFLTPKELEILSKRFSILYWISKKRNYANIQNNLKVSNATITETKKLVNKKTIDKILRRIDADEWADKWSKKIAKLWG